MASKVFSIKELAEILRLRQHNEFDCNIAVSGQRGNGKSTFLFKLLSRFENFDPWEQVVYSRDDTIHLLETQQFGIIFDDEAISTGYKREFHNVNQQKLIKMMNMYRDNFNIFASAIPSFGDLDKDMKKLMKFHIQIVKRGLGIVHVANNDKSYSQDPWDVKYNEKLEEKWNEKKKKNPNFSPPYHKLTTFAGYIEFGDLPPRQKDIYKQIKLKKRKQLYEKEIEEKKEPDAKEMVFQSLMKFLKNGSIMEFSQIRYPLISVGIIYDQGLRELNKRIKEELPEWSVERFVKYNREQYGNIPTSSRHLAKKNQVNSLTEDNLIPNK